jgi:hypothetical protein
LLVDSAIGPLFGAATWSGRPTGVIAIDGSERRSAIPSTGRASRLRRCSRVVSISLRKLLARMPVCDVNVLTDGFPFDPKD